MGYSKSAWAKQLGISRKELEDRTKAAGFEHTEDFYYATGGTGVMPKTPEQIEKEQQQKITDFMGRYQGAIAKQPTMQDVWNRVAQERGLEEQRGKFTGLMGQVGTIQEQLEKTPEQIAGETRGFDVNAAQRARLEQVRQGELAKTLSPIAKAAEVAGTGYNLALAEAGNQITAEQYQQEKELAPYATEAELLDSALARQVTMYTTDKQNQLDLMLKRLANNQAISEKELDQLNQLALLEKEYELKKNQFDYERKFKTASEDDGWA